MSQALREEFPDLAALVDNLVTEDDEPVDNILSAKQQRLLTEPLYSSWTPPADEDEPDKPRAFWADANVGIFQSVYQPPIVPDVFVSLDIEAPADPRDKDQRSYFVWEFGKLPEVVLEIVSNRKGGELQKKLKDYARLGINYYVVYDPFGALRKELGDDQLVVYEIGFGKRYRRRQDHKLPDVGLSLTLWEGSYEGCKTTWLRWCDVAGNLILTGKEARDLEAARAAQEAERATREAERANRAEAELARLRAERAGPKRRSSKKRP